MNFGSWLTLDGALENLYSGVPFRFGRGAVCTGEDGEEEDDELHLSQKDEHNIRATEHR